MNIEVEMAKTAVTLMAISGLNDSIRTGDWQTAINLADIVALLTEQDD